MTEVTKQKGILRPKAEQDNRVREWEEGLPSLADLICLSQCLISPQLASAFCITSPPSSPLRSATDVALASHAAFFSLPSTSPAYPDLVGSSDIPEVNPYPQSEEGDHASHGAEEPQLNAGDSTCLGGEAPHVNLYPQGHEGDCSLNVGLASERIHDRQAQSKERYLTDFTPLDAKERRNDGEVPVREWRGLSQPALAGHVRTHDADISVRKDHGSSAPSDGYRGGVLKASERVEDGMVDGDGHVQANAALCILDSSDVARQLDDGEAEGAESVPSPSENLDEETTVRTLKRPRLVWNPELHKRFVDAVSHLGVKTAVPKTIMQLMNVEGLTRENVASHLQKYRLYLKRMQGLSNEGPTSSDHLFASTPIPANLAMSGRFNAGIPAHLQDFTQVPFTPSHNPASIGRGHVAGIMSSPLSPMNHHSFNFFARPPNRFVQGDPKDVQVSRHKHAAPLQHTPKK